MGHSLEASARPNRFVSRSCFLRSEHFSSPAPLAIGRLGRRPPQAAVAGGPFYMAGVVVDDATLIVTSYGRGPSAKRFRLEQRAACPPRKRSLRTTDLSPPVSSPGLERFPRYGSENSICLRRCAGISRRSSRPAGPPSLPLLVGSLRGGLGTNSVDRPASAGVEGHVLVGNGLATLRADLPRGNRTPGRVVSVDSK